MIAILSPAKNMREAPARPSLPITVPKRGQEAQQLMEMLQKIPNYALESIMKISPRLALKAVSDFAAWSAQGGTPAALTYNGLAYQHLNADTLTDADLMYAQEHLRHLSALYGALRPLDGIHPYRLEMAHRPRGWDLYQFWGSKLWEDLYAETDTVINLASNEYSKAISAYLKPKGRYITCEFLCDRGGKLRCLAAIAKMARGAMARYLIEARVDDVQGLMQFEGLDFSFAPDLSNEMVYTFVRKE